MRRPRLRPFPRSGPTVALGVGFALAMAAVACGDEQATSSAVEEGSSEFDVGAAAAAVEEVLETGRRVDVEPGACPYGATADLALLLPDGAEVTAAMRAGDVVDDGQLYFGDPAIVYCPIRASDDSLDNAEIDEFRVDVASGPVDVLTYLDENFDTVAADDLVERSDQVGGDVVVVCHDDGCTGAWQRDDLFVAVTLIDGQEPSATEDDAEAALETIVPVVVDRLSSLGTRRAELAALAQSHFADVYDQEAWDAWDSMVLSGDTENYQLWIDYEVEEGTITSAEGEELLEHLNALPGDELWPD